MAISPTDSLQRAPENAHEYMLIAVRSIDMVFGNGYAKDHPELVGAFIQTCALDYLANRLGIQLEAIDDNIGVLGSSLSEIAEAVNKNG